MKLVTYEWQNGRGIGVFQEEQIFPIKGVDSMIALIEMGDDGRARAQAALDSGENPVPESEITFLPPVVRPGKVIALGRNYAAHAAEGGSAPPDYPMLFHKTHTSLNGHNRPIVIPPGTEKVDFEAELAVIIGQRCKNVLEEDALNVVYGYAVANDVTARDWQRRTSQFTAGKMVDGFGPLGPALVTADEVEDVQGLDIRSYLNGEMMQSGNTRMMIFSVAFMIAYISRITTLEPGDVILTGTPEGVGFARTPPVYMKPGDEIVVEIDGVGRLTNTFVAA